MARRLRTERGSQSHKETRPTKFQLLNTGQCTRIWEVYRKYPKSRGKSGTTATPDLSSKMTGEVLYRGISSNNAVLPMLIEEGIGPRQARAGAQGEFGYGVYLTRDLPYAIEYARGGPNGVVLADDNFSD
ncbi:hypothetical protein HKX48_008204 [Thoreauomyces humboldtii]|nr:hypothetical protein HKX48_008204 [Thoreauomyces humboldtii]